MFGLRILTKWLLVLSLVVAWRLATAGPIVIDFEAFEDQELLASQLDGITFTNALVLKAGYTLNEAEFPPRSGDNVIVDYGGPITIQFYFPVSVVEGYFTYLAKVTMTAYDADMNPVAVSNSSFMENYVSSENPIHDLLGVGWAAGISSVVIAGWDQGYSFVLDDLRIYGRDAGFVPTPETPVLLLVGLLLFVLIKRVDSRRVW